MHALATTNARFSTTEAHCCTVVSASGAMMAMPAFATNGRGDFIYTDSAETPHAWSALRSGLGAACASSTIAKTQWRLTRHAALRVAIVHTPTL
jgi:hypothetical protein